MGESGEYFVALLPDGSRLVHPIPYGERFPLNYGREVLAELAGVPHRWAEAPAQTTAVVEGGVWARFCEPAALILVAAPSLGRAAWKACAASKQEEEARCERFKEAFKPFDIMQ